ncbi:hypothetical protein OIU85_003856, partial [Salix viminalis]
DDDTNYHMDLIAGLANMRARNYSIPEVDKLKAKFITGRIIPDMSWTVWDRWILKDNPTLRELLRWLKNKGLDAYSISHGSCLLYNSMFPRHKDRMDRKMVDLVREVAKAELPPYRHHFDVVAACEDDEGNDVDIPPVSIYFS